MTSAVRDLLSAQALVPLVIGVVFSVSRDWVAIRRTRIGLRRLSEITSTNSAKTFRTRHSSCSVRSLTRSKC